MISFYFYPEYSGSAKQMVCLIKALRKHNIRSFVISAQLNPAWPLEEIIDGIKIIRIPNIKNGSIFWFWIGVGFQLWKKRNLIDIVHSHGLNYLHGFSLFIGHLLGKATVGKLSIANSDINFGGQGRLIGRLHKLFLKHADRYVAISSALREEIAKSGLHQEKCVMIPNGVDTTIYYKLDSKGKKLLRQRLGFNDDFIVLFVGVIDQRKGIDTLIPAFRQVLLSIPRARLVLIGPPNREDKNSYFMNSMIQLTHKYKIQDRVEFRGYDNNPAQYFQTADLFVLPSRQEGLANVLIEAMACGLPAIGTSISGSEDLIENNINGVLVRPGDSVELANAMTRMVQQPDDYIQMSKNAHTKIREKYELEKIVESYIELYENIFQENASQSTS